MEPRPRALARPIALSFLCLALSACQPRTSAEDLLLDAKHPMCRFEPLTVELDDAIEQGLVTVGREGGVAAAMRPARAYTDRLTGDGYLVRKAGATLVMGLFLLGAGALGAALLLSLGGRRPSPRWAERVVQSLTREIDQVRALPKSGDPLLTELVKRFDEVLNAASAKANTLLQRALPLAKRAEAPTAAAHLESLHGQLEALLGQVEHLHLHLLAWQERQHVADRDALERQVAAVVAELTAAMKEVG